MEGHSERSETHHSWHYNPEEDHLKAAEGNDLQRLLANEVFGNVCASDPKPESCCMKHWVMDGVHNEFRTWVEEFIADHQDRDTLTYEDVSAKLTEWKEKFGDPAFH